MGNVLRTLLHGEPPQNITTSKEFVDEALSIATHAMRAGVHTTLGSSPGSLVFNRDMFLNIPLIPDWHAITKKREHLIHENLLRENQKRRRHDYAPQQPVLKKRWKPRKLDERTSSLYRVLQTHVNGTVTIELRPGVSERLNIRRIIPYKEWMLTYIRYSPAMWHTYLDWGIVRKGFQGFPFHQTKWRTNILLDVYLSGEECSAHQLCVDLVMGNHTVALTIQI